MMDDDSFLYQHRIKSQTAVLSETLLPVYLAPDTFFFFFFSLLTCCNASIEHIIIFSALLLAGSEVIVSLDLLRYFLAGDAKMLEMSSCRKNLSGVREIWVCSTSADRKKNNENI